MLLRLSTPVFDTSRPLVCVTAANWAERSSSWGGGLPSWSMEKPAWVIVTIFRTRGSSNVQCSSSSFSSTVKDGPER